MPRDLVDGTLHILFRVLEEHGGFDRQLLYVVIWSLSVEVFFVHVDLIVHFDHILDFLCHYSAAVDKDVSSDHISLETLSDVIVSTLLFGDVHFVGPASFVVEHLFGVHIHSFGVHGVLRVLWDR